MFSSWVRLRMLPKYILCSLNYLSYYGLTDANLLRNTVMWSVTVQNLVYIYRCFGGACYVSIFRVELWTELGRSPFVKRDCRSLEWMKCKQGEQWNNLTNRLKKSSRYHTAHEHCAHISLCVSGSISTQSLRYYRHLYLCQSKSKAIP
jgi:hypothetical protein